MTLLGRANWWLPRWLGRVLPSVDFERSGQPAPQPERAAPAAAPQPAARAREHVRVGS
jgi:RND superfamily putative drug exporter